VVSLPEDSPVWDAYDKGREAFAAGQFAEALAHFEAVAKEVDSVHVLVYLVRTQAALKRCDDALHYLPFLRQQLAVLLSELKGAQRGQTKQLQVALAIDEAKCKQIVKQRAQAALAKARDDGGPKDGDGLNTIVQRDNRAQSARSMWGWISVSAGAALLVGSGVSAAQYAQINKSTADNSAEREQRIQDGEMYSTLAFALAGAAVALGGMGAYLLLTGSPSDADASAVIMYPLVYPTGIGVGLAF
jgi:hypothetical protein